jgi:hypothetical protein
MWIPRSSGEIASWHAAAVREARTQAWFDAGLVWLGITVVLAAGWLAGGGSWLGLPIIAMLGLLVAYWRFVQARSRGFERSLQMTICPKCESAGEGNVGTICACGGTVVLQSSVRWVDEPEQHESATRG